MIAKTFRTLLLAALLLPAAVFVSACSTTSKKVADEGQDIAFTEVKRYFFKNDQTPPAECFKITTKKDFEKYFGMAPVMGTDGEPTSVDFSKECVCAVVEPETSLSTTLRPVSMRFVGGKLQFKCGKRVSKQMRSFTIVPVLIVKYDKKYSSCPVELVWNE